MDRKKLLKRITFLILFIFIINFLATKFYWYYSIWWFDMPMHFLGGVWVGLAMLWFLFKENLSFKLIFKVILGVLLIGVLWEIYEVLVNNAISQIPFNTLDTLSDLFFDLAGGSLAMFYFLKRIITINKNTLQ